MLLSIAPLLVVIIIAPPWLQPNIKQDNLPIDLIHRQAVQRVIHDAACVRGREFETLNSLGTLKTLPIVSAFVSKLQVSEFQRPRQDDCIRFSCVFH